MVVERTDESSSTQLLDVEDLGQRLKSKAENGDVKEMLTAPLRTALTKQGYKLIGSHSGVKMCRWTKVSIRELWF